MDFALASDLHLDFGGIPLLPRTADAKVLVLAGDTIEVDFLKKTSGLQKEIIKYFQELNENFETVIYLMGNHEFYHNSFIHTERNLRTEFAKAGLTNFVVLEKSTIEIDDTIFFGATMWTTCDNENPTKMMAVESAMNDYNHINTGKGPWGDVSKLNTRDTAAVCKMTKKKIQEFVDLKTDKNKVLLTHMAPCFLSIPDSRKFHPANSAYYEDITEMLLDSDIKVACHGHVHKPVDYLVGETRIVSNPRGYHGAQTFGKNFEFKIINSKFSVSL